MPRLGLGMPIVSGASNAPVTVIDDVLWEDFGGSGGEIAVNYQETRTNIVLRSQDTTNAEAWTKTNTAIDSTLYEAPDNSTTANAIKSDSTGEKLYSITQSNLSVTAGKTYTASVHLKKDALGFAKLRFNDGTINYSATFNLTTGANVQTGNLIGTTNKTSTDTMDDGWFRCSMTFQAQNTTSSGFLRVSPQADASTANPNIAVSGIVLIYVWGFQLEESIEATTYIVTTTEARTRTTTLNDTSDVWDFDGADLTPEADPDSEGVWEIPANIVLNGDYEELGSEQLRNGTFDTDSEWSKGTGWSIANGKASITESGSVTLAQTLTSNLTSGKTYEVVYTISGYSGSGIVKAQFTGGSTVSGQNRIENGTHTEYLTATASHTGVRLKALSNNGGFTGSIDNVSVKQVDPNDRWTLGDGWSIEDGKAISTTAQSNLTSTAALVVGNTYEFTLTSAAVSSGSYSFLLRFNSTNTDIGTVNSDGTHTFRVVADSTSFRLQTLSGGGTSFSIDNVTVTEYAIQPRDV